ncbi:Unknown protein [Striga hermonthica]|uniref:DC1 domain-containing protein n=1 Tax=Striga hermonthica TaxID=68872 RepID=A0A9N7NI90_STRHE|nr:Unknown protein [Striga hermonthica]
MSSRSQRLSDFGISTETDHFDWDTEEGNNMDLDEANSETCSACLLPIFLTPFTRDPNNNRVVMHDECSGEDSFPQKLRGHALHPKGDLILYRQHPSIPLDARLSCRRCGSTCGTIFYKCPDDSSCNFTLDLKCACPVRVLHRSHRHRLTVKRRRGRSFICYACGCLHERPTSDEWVLCYECADCDFQIHGDCAVLPNAIVLQHHHHPLLLQYYSKGYVSPYPCNICDRSMFERYYERERESYECGYYACVACWFSTHINCAIKPFQHKPVQNDIPMLIFSGIADVALSQM